ncbi:MAG: hypothetical protein WC890_06370 [Candidatus Margulisiibacteriota bacterium]
MKTKGTTLTANRFFPNKTQLSKARNTGSTRRLQPHPNLAAGLPTSFRPHIETTSAEYIELSTNFVNNLDFAELDSSDRALLNDALQFMLSYYSCQPMDTEHDPIQHMVKVAKRVVTWGGNPTLAAAAILHALPLERILASEIDDSVKAIVREKKVLTALLHTPLNEESITAEEWGYLAKMCLMEPLNAHTWLLEAADSFCELYSSELENGQLASYARRSFYVLPVALRLLNLEEIAIALENLAFMHLDRVAFEQTEELIAILNGRERAAALEHLKNLTGLISLELEKNHIDHRVEVDVKSVVSTRKKVEIEGETGLTDTGRFRYVIDGESADCLSATKVILSEMESMGYFLNINETRNFIDGVSLEGLAYSETDGFSVKLGTLNNFGQKENGYQSIHLSFCDRYGSFINVQIRTRSMHERATIGSAAHAISYKLAGLLQGLTICDGQDPIQAMRTEQRRYAIYHGRIFRLIPYPAGQGQIASPLDLAFAGNERLDTAFRTPNQVAIVRIDRRTGNSLHLKVSRGAPLMNGDILPEATSSHAIATARQLLSDSHTYFAQLVLGLARKKHLTAGKSASEAQSDGFRKIHAIVSPFEAALSAEFNSAYSKMVSKNVPPISIHYSLERIAMAMNIGSFNRLESLLGLSADSELIQAAIKEQLRLNSVAYLAQQPCGQFSSFVVYFPLLPGIQSALLGELRTLGVEESIFSIESRPSFNKLYKMLFVTLQSIRNRREVFTQLPSRLNAIFSHIEPVPSPTNYSYATITISCESPKIGWLVPFCIAIEERGLCIQGYDLSDKEIRASAQGNATIIIRIPAGKDYRREKEFIDKTAKQLKKEGATFSVNVTEGAHTFWK